MYTQWIVKVNIGSGPNGKSDWINLDWGILPLLSKLPWVRQPLINLHLLSEEYSCTWPDNLRLWDCRRRLPFTDRSINYIYISHFIEHLPRYQCIKLLSECKRVLCLSGILRISVPDLKLLAEKYIYSKIDFFLRLDNFDRADNQLKSLGDMFVKHFYGYDCYSQPSFIQRIQRKFIRGHLWMYDYESLRDILHSRGFSNIQRCEPCKGRVPDIDYLDIHKEGSLFIEASTE